MTQRCYPLNDDNYTAEDVRLYHAGRTSGIFNLTGEDLQVSWTSGMNVSISKGCAYLLTDVDGFGGVTYANTSSVTLSTDTASSNTRYDYVAVRYTKAKNTCELVYVRGDTSMPKACVRTANIYEIIIAIIQVPGNASSLSAACIIDTRLNETFCGIVTDGTNKVPTQEMYDRFNVFLAQLEEALDGNTAGNLMNKIKANTDAIKTNTDTISEHTASIRDHTDSINSQGSSIGKLSSRMDSAEKNIGNLSSANNNLSNRVSNLENFKWKVGTSYPNTSTCPNGYFYFQIEG